MINHAICADDLEQTEERDSKKSLLPLAVDFIVMLQHHLTAGWRAGSGPDIKWSTEMSEGCME